MRLMRLWALAALCLAAWTSAAQASARTTYDLVLTINEVQQFAGGDCSAATWYYSFGCLDVGDTFVGHFSVDSDILAVDGANNTAAVFDFYLPFGEALYSTGADNLTLAGFRNPALGAAAPGFLIEGGQVVDLIGGVYGFADIPFIDMYDGHFIGRNSFSAYDGGLAANGSLAISAAVPEPETYATMLAGLALVSFWARRRKRGAAAAESAAA